MKIHAYAKINLALDVVRKQMDGYHELDMIMTPITLHDTLEVVLSDKDTFTCTIDLAWNESNTMYRVVEAMRSKYALDACFAIHLTKRIPMQAGLGGGSSDAAALIECIDTLCHLKLSQQDKLDIGLTIGADVPFCITQKLSRVRGIGEKIEPIHSQLQYKMLLVKPKTGVSTKDAFTAIDFKNVVHPKVEEIVKRMEHNKEFIHMLDNTLETIAITLNDDIQQVIYDLTRFPFDKVLMSGSGSCVFALSNQESLLLEVKHSMEKKYPFVEICEMR